MNDNETLLLISQKEKSGIHLGLERIKTALAALGSPQDRIKTIHIAGTNGKGSIASSIANSLSAAGFRVGLFTSPWVIDYREQIQINGEFISEENLARLFKNINAAFPELTEFELLTAAAFEYFCESAVDFAVIECGMGGMLDATNVIKRPAVSAITEISLDHTAYLGDSIDEIARHKAGIIKKNCATVLYPNAVVQNIFESVCKANNAPLIKAADMGDFRLNNRETVRLCLDALGLRIPVKKPSLPARLEKIGGNVLLDGSHNLSAARALRDYLSEHSVSGVSAVISMMKDKNAAAYLEITAPFCKKIYACRAGNERAMGTAELSEIAEKYCTCVVQCESPEAAVDSALADGAFVLVCGSFYLARDIRNKLISGAENKF